ncbi:hypothetical protein D3C85_1775870 [compost metagenome]
MHPGDYANTIYIDISLLQRFKYLLRCFYYGFIYDLNGDLWRGIQRSGNLLRMFRYLL